MEKLQAIKPTIQGLGGITLLGIVPDATTMQTALQLGIAAITAIVQLVSLFKKKK